MNNIIGLFFKQVKWDSNIFFQCAHTMSPQIREIVMSGQLSVPEDQFYTKDEQIKMIIQNQRYVLGQQACIMSLWLYKTPLNENQWTSYYFNHHYIILQLSINEKQTKYCCLQKTRKRISIIYSDTFQYVRDYQFFRPGQENKRCLTTYWKPQQIDKFLLYSDFFQLLKHLLLSQQHEKCYDPFYDNCHDFCTHVIQFLKKHEIK